MALNLIFYLATLKFSAQLTLKFSKVGLFILQIKHSYRFYNFTNYSSMKTVNPSEFNAVFRFENK